MKQVIGATDIETYELRDGVNNPDVSASRES
jgi:hypothetical protein